MNWPLIVSIGGLAVAVGAHVVATIWWAAKLTFNLEAIQKEIKDIKEELKEENFETRAQIKAMWSRLDEVKERLIKLESK